MDTFEKLYNKALRFLSYRPRSEKEVRDHLLRHSGKRGISAPRIDSGQDVRRPQARMTIIEQVVIKLKDKSFLNDEEFARWWVEQRTTVRPKAIRVIKAELQQKGISKEIIEKILSNRDMEILGGEIVRKLIEKRLLRYEGLESKEKREKMTGFLARRGFDYDIIRDALDEALGRSYNGN